MVFRETMIIGAACRSTTSLNALPRPGAPGWFDQQQVIADGKINLVGMAVLAPESAAFRRSRHEKHSAHALPRVVKRLRSKFD